MLKLSRRKHSHHDARPAHGDAVDAHDGPLSAPANHERLLWFVLLAVAIII
jgi:hypothetical protein